MGNTLLYKEHYEKQIQIHKVYELQAGLNCLILIIYIIFYNMTKYFYKITNYSSL